MEILKLYGGAVDIHFDERRHTYKHPGGRIIANPSSVNKLIAKPFLIPWAAKKAIEHIRENIEPYTPYSEIEVERMLRAAQREYDEYSKDRMAVGTRVHNWIEAHIKHQLGQRPPKSPPSQPGPVQNGVIAFLDWEMDEEPEYLFTERVVYSRVGDHIGTADAGAITKSSNGRPTLFDWKTGSGIYLEHAYQLAGYSAALTEEEPEVWDWPDRNIVHLKTDTAKYSQYDEARLSKRTTGRTIQQDYATFRRFVDNWYDLQDGPSAYNFR